MNWKDFCVEYHRAYVETTAGKSKVHHSLHLILWFKAHKKLRKYMIHSLILTLTMAVVLTMFRSALFISAELSVTVLAHAYEIVTSFVSEKAE